MARPRIPRDTAAGLGLALLALALAPGCRAGGDAATVDEAGGTATEAGSPPQRVVSMAPNITETLFALGAGDQVAAVTDFCSYPPDEIAALPRVGAYLNPDVERMLALRPDLVVLLPSQDRTRERMEAAGVATLTVRNESLDEVLASIEAIGEATGHADAGAALAAELRAELDDLAASLADREPTSVLVVIGRGGGDLQGIFAVGPGTFLDAVITAAGGRNVLADAPTLYPQVPLEEVLLRAPAVIVEVVVPPSQLAPDEVAAAWGTLSSVPAVRDGRIHVISDDYLLIPGPRALRTAERLAPLLHPDLATATATAPAAEHAGAAR